MRLRRRRYFIVRVADEPVLDIARFLRGAVEMRAAPRCTLLCPVRGLALPIAPAELAMAMSVPADRWLTAEELAALEAPAQGQLRELAARGVLLAEPAAAGWEDLVPGEQEIERTQWHDVAAVYHAHTQWHGVTGEPGDSRSGTAHAASAPDEASPRWRGDPPPHFVRRGDAHERIALGVPRLEGPFFEALLARRTTRTYRSHTPLPVSALECMLYAVFGTHGIKDVAPGLAAIKRTSPSGGALHPIEAYLLAMNVEGIAPGLYHYETATHALAAVERMDARSARETARTFTAGQAWFAEAHALVVHVARFDRTFWKYARHRKAYKVVLMDSAHLSQTFYLAAAHLGLGASYTSAINDVDIARRLRLPRWREAAVGINGVGLADLERDALGFLPDPYELPRA